ncbi:MAG: hypothetical protein JW951_08200 [Lentisphaerae bacterium]|nr:hypothetical protein [Lentisphaerota bacterium]
MKSSMLVGTLAAVVVFCGMAEADLVTNLPSADRGIEDKNPYDGVGDTLRDWNENSMLVGDYDDATWDVGQRGAIVYELPALTWTQNVRQATLRVYLENFTGTPFTNLSLVHLPNWNEGLGAGTENAYHTTPANVVAPVLITPTSPDDTWYSADVTDEVRADYANDSGDAWSTFRLQMQGPDGCNQNDVTERYVIRSKDFLSGSGSPYAARLVLDIGRAASVTTNVLVRWTANIQDNDGDGNGDDFRGGVNDQGTSYVGDGEGIGGGGADWDLVERDVAVFELPEAPDGYIYKSAQVVFYLNGFNSQGTPVPEDCQLMHVPDLNGAPGFDSYQEDATLVNDAFVTSSSASSTFYTNDVSAYVRWDYENDTSSPKCSAFRLQDDAPFPTPPNGNGQSDRYVFMIRKDANWASQGHQWPRLRINYERLLAGSVILLR